MKKSLYTIERKLTASKPVITAVKSMLKDFGTPEAIEYFTSIHTLEIQVLGDLQSAAKKHAVADELRAQLAAKEERVTELSRGVASIANEELGQSLLQLDLIDRGDALQLSADVLRALEDKKGVVAQVRDVLAKAHRECLQCRTAFAKATAAADRADAEIEAVFHTLQSKVAVGRSLLASEGMKVATRRSAKKKPVTPTLAISPAANTTEEPVGGLLAAANQ